MRQNLTLHINAAQHPTWGTRRVFLASAEPRIEGESTLAPQRVTPVVR
jgi:hypothetical protein